MSARRGLRRAATLILAAAALLALPASALASKGFVLDASTVTYARVHGTNGYRLNFSENDKRFFAARVVGHDSTTSYELRGGPVTGGRVSANLGRRGRFDLRFVPVGKAQKVPVVSWCEGAVGRWQAGYLVGRIRFRGEGGYTEVRLEKVPAAREAEARLRCHLPASLLRGHPGRRRAQVALAGIGSGRKGAPSAGFGAILYHRHARPAGRRVVFRATRRDSAGRLRISREVKVEAPESTFAFIGGSKLPEELEVTPPAPFSGSATFTRTPESVFEWKGDLAVSFPGLARPVRLTGPSYLAAVCGENGCVHQVAGAAGESLFLAHTGRGRAW